MNYALPLISISFLIHFWGSIPALPISRWTRLLYSWTPGGPASRGELQTPRFRRLWYWSVSSRFSVHKLPMSIFWKPKTLPNYALPVIIPILYWFKCQASRIGSRFVNVVSDNIFTSPCMHSLRQFEAAREQGRWTVVRGTEHAGGCNSWEQRAIQGWILNWCSTWRKTTLLLSKFWDCKDSIIKKRSCCWILFL